MQTLHTCMRLISLPCPASHLVLTPIREERPEKICCNAGLIYQLLRAFHHIPCSRYRKRCFLQTLSENVRRFCCVTVRSCSWELFGLTGRPTICWKGTIRSPVTWVALFKRDILISWTLEADLGDARVVTEYCWGRSSHDRRIISGRSRLIFRVTTPWTVEPFVSSHDSDKPISRAKLRCVDCNAGAQHASAFFDQSPIQTVVERRESTSSCRPIARCCW